MKITKIETFLADAGWRPWAFVKVQTDEGLVGYGEATCLLTQYAVLSAIEDLKPVLIGNDPLAFEARYWDMYRRTRLGSVGGVAGKAIGAIECALLDIKGKSLNVSVAELFGGPLREWVPLYFSHACVGRAIAPDIIGVKPVRSLLDVKEACIQIVEKGFNSLKTNIVYPGDPALVHQEGFGGGPGTTDQVVSTEMVRHTARFIGAIREAVGPDVGIILDLNFNFKPESVIRICRALEEYDLSWVELDLYDPDALRMIKDSIRMPVCSCETLFYMEQYRPYFEKHALDIVMLDAPWQGFAQAKKVGDLAQVYQMNVCPHNYYSHLLTHINAQLCAVLPNVHVMEYEGEDVPWRNDIVTKPPEIVNGQMKVPSGPGWGTEPNEKELKRHSWDRAGRTVTVPSGFAAIGATPALPSTAASRGSALDETVTDGSSQVMAYTAYDRIMGPWAKSSSKGEHKREDLSLVPLPEEGSRNDPTSSSGGEKK